MTWQYLVDGGHLSVIFKGWYSIAGNILFATSIIVMILIVFWSQIVRRKNTQDNHVFPQRMTILFSVSTFIFSSSYMILFWRITKDPDAMLTTRSLQQLSVADFQTAMRFLILFSGLGVFLIVVNLAVAAFFLQISGGIGGLMGYEA